MMNGFSPVSFAKNTEVSISKTGIIIPVTLMPMFPDSRCNYLENGAMIALQPSGRGDIEINRPGNGHSIGRIGRKVVIRRAANTLGVTLGKSVKLNTWTDEGCLVFTKRKMEA